VQAGDEGRRQSQRDEDAVKITIEKNAWLKKLPHIAFVEPAWSKDYGMYIAVFADEDESVSVVERECPSKLDGYPVVVLPPQRGEYL